MKLDKQSFASLIKVVIFLVITTAATIILALLLTGGSFFKATNTYRAVVSNATGVTGGSDVRISGVLVGNVSGVEVLDRTKAVITFSVGKDVRLTGNTNVHVLFRNLVGLRYLSLTQGPEGAKSTLKPGSTIPMSRTTEALDLNVLFNGFKPVFEGLSPEDTNKFATELVKTLQGEGGSIEALLSRTASLTNTLAGRDKLIGDVITNLSEVLQTVGNRDQELTETIDTLQQFVTGLKDDRNAILNSIDSVSGLAQVTSDLLEEGRPPLTKDIKQLRRLTGNLSTDANKKELAHAIQILPIKMSRLGNAASYGTAFNFYLCDLVGTITLPAIGGIDLGPILKGLNALPGIEVGDDGSITLGDLNPAPGIQVHGGRCDR